MTRLPERKAILSSIAMGLLATNAVAVEPRPKVPTRASKAVAGTKTPTEKATTKPGRRDSHREPIERYRTEEGTISYLPAVELLAGKSTRKSVPGLGDGASNGIHVGVKSRFVAAFSDPGTGAPRLVLTTITKARADASETDRTGWERETTVYPLRRQGLRAGRFVVRDPLFSPDGRQVLLKFYDPNDSFLDLKYRLYVLNTVSGTVQRLTRKILAFPQVSWSPDGQYVAFLHGGSEYGDTHSYRAFREEYLGPLKLYVVHVATNRLHLVRTSDSLSNFSWTGSHTLVYGALTDQELAQWQETQLQELLERSKIQPEQQLAGAARPTQTGKGPRPDLWEYSPETRKSALVMHDAYRATPAPDGSRFAFYGSEDPGKPLALQEGWRQLQQDAAVLVAKRGGSARMVLDKGDGFYPILHWLSDGTTLALFGTVRNSPRVKVIVKEWNTASGEFRRLADIDIEDGKEHSVQLYDPRVVPLSSSADGRWLYVRMWRVTGFSRELAQSLKQFEVVRIRRTDGKTEKILSTGMSNGLHWQAIL